MSNCLIFYKHLDPLGDVAQLDDKVKKAYQTFFQPLTLAVFKDCIKRSRMAFTDPKDKNALPGWTPDFMIDFVLHPLITESIHGEVKEVKGNINELLRIIFNEERSLKNKEEPDLQIIQKSKRKITYVLKIVIENAFVEFERKKAAEDQTRKAFECEEEFTQTLNCVMDLIDTVGFRPVDLENIHEIIQDKWIPYQRDLLERLISRVINEKHFLTKHVDMIGDALRNVSSTMNRLAELISDELVEFIMVQLNILLSNCLRLKKEIVSHASILFITIKLARNKKSIEEIIDEILSIEDSSDEKSLQKLSKVRALFACDGKNVPFHKYKLIEYVNSFLNHSHPELKLYALTVMLLMLECAQQSIYKDEFAKNETLQFDIYENVQRSLEYPAKKISYWIETILTSLIACNDHPVKLAEKYAKTALQLNVSSSKRKYYLLAILHPFLSPEFLNDQDPNLIPELMIACGDFYVLPAPGLLYRILNSLYLKTCNSELHLWRKYWEHHYFNCLNSQPLPVVKGMIAAVNQILARINKNAVVYMLSAILDSSKGDLNDKNSLWIFVSFLKVARERNLVIDGTDGSFSLQGSQITISRERLEKLILNKDRNIIINILDFISYNPKPSELPSDIEFELMLLFLKYGTRTSYPDYRNDLLSSFKRFIERMRLVYERDVQAINSGQPPKKKNFTLFVSFIQRCVDTIFATMYPSMSFEIANPMLEILHLILSNFPSHKSYEYRKGLFIQPSNFLQTHIIHPPLFSQSNMECLLVNANSLWESVRQLSVCILLFFPPATVSVDYVKNLYTQALTLCKNPQIKNYEVGASIMQLLYCNFLHVFGMSKTQFLSQLIQTLKNDFKNFTESFLVDWQLFTDSLVHGQITALAFIVQKLTNENIENTHEMKKVLSDMFEIVRDIIAFSTKISSENITSVVLDSSQSSKKLLDDEREKQISSIDCRGHVIFDKEAKQKNKFLQNMEKILQGNTLIEALEDNGAGDEGVGTENMLVVAFYLISREAGFLFQAISSLVILCQKEYIDIFDKPSLESIVNQYFHTLVNVKHLGSIDRIAIGLNTMCKAMNEVKNPILPYLSSTLLEKLLDHIEANTFKNVMRRSAGLPSAITCLLKAESKRQKSVPSTIKRLLDMSEHSPHKQVKIHALNILKRIFEDSTIKLDVDKFIGIGFMTAIKGFAIEDWSIRNSSLMLFSALSLRTVGGSKNPNSQTIKSKLNLVEFFTRAPELLEFFLQEISAFVHTDKYAHTQYPPLYPIALLFTRLLPYDLKNQVKKAPSQAEEESEESDTTEQSNHISESQPAQYIALSEVQKILPLLIQCANNKNYMGRVMVARSILPFMVFEKIPAESVSLLNSIESLEMARKSHNFCHGILLQILNVLKTYYEMKKETGLDYDQLQNTQLRENERQLALQLKEKSFLLTQIKCPPVQYAFLDLLRAFIENIHGETLADALNIFKDISEHARTYIDSQIGAGTLRIQDDMGHSVLRKKLLRYLLRNQIIYAENKSINLHLSYLTISLTNYQNNPHLFKEEDNELLRVLLKEFLIGLKSEEKLCLSDCLNGVKSVVSLMINVLANKESHQYFFSQCIQLMLKIIFRLGVSDKVIEPIQLQQFWEVIKRLEKQFEQNGLLVKQLVKLSGLLIGMGNIDVEYFEQMCARYSQSQQMDYLRIAVIIAFKLCMEKLLVILQASQYSIFLRFCLIFLRLLQDEVPEVRQKMSNFLCKQLLGGANGKSKTKEDTFLFEVSIKNVFDMLANEEVDADSSKQLNRFLLSHLFEMEFFSIKKINHFENRIFAYDKSNKFIDEMRIKKLAFNALLARLLKYPNTLTFQEFEDFVTSKKYDFLLLTPERRQKYSTNFSYRDEFEFENNLNSFIYENLKSILSGGEAILADEEKEPFIRYFFQI